MKIFINYRRIDADNTTKVGKIAASLKRHFGDSNVIFDKEDFRLGHDFTAEIRTELLASDYVLVMIPRQWAYYFYEREYAIKRYGGTDWVLEEIKLALQHKKLIIPIFWDDATMPLEDELPKEIGALRNFNGLPISTSSGRFAQSIRMLIRRIEKDKGIAFVPARDTKEYVDYLLRYSEWDGKSIDKSDVYICEMDNNYRIFTEIENTRDIDKGAIEWVDKFPGDHICYTVHIQKNGSNIDTVYFVYIKGGRLYLPLTSIDQQGNYYWDANSTAFLVAQHISILTDPYETLDAFAEFFDIQIIGN